MRLYRGDRTALVIADPDSRRQLRREADEPSVRIGCACFAGNRPFNRASHTIARAALLEYTLHEIRHHIRNRRRNDLLLGGLRFI
ncbi:hypothetical protein D3C85_1289490 [compost metagenome]